METIALFAKNDMLFAVLFRRLCQSDDKLPLNKLNGNFSSNVRKFLLQVRDYVYYTLWANKPKLILQLKR